MQLVACRDAGLVAVVVRPDGTATFVWQDSDGIWARSRATDGALSGARRLAPAGASFRPYASIVGANRDGTIAVMYETVDGVFGRVGR